MFAQDFPTLSEIKKRIPSHCFRSSFLRSISFVFKDVFLVSFSFFAMKFIENRFSYGFTLFPIYWFFQGFFFGNFFLRRIIFLRFFKGTFYTSFFVLGHDCGHGSFSSSPLCNDFFGTSRRTFFLLFENENVFLRSGTLLHSWILVPYFPWKVSQFNVFRTTRHDSSLLVDSFGSSQKHGKHW